MNRNRSNADLLGNMQFLNASRDRIEHLESFSKEQAEAVIEVMMLEDDFDLSKISDPEVMAAIVCKARDKMVKTVQEVLETMNKNGDFELGNYGSDRSDRLDVC